MKSFKKSEQIFKKNSAPIQFKFFELYKPVEHQYSSSSRKNQEDRKIATLSLELRSYN